MASKRKTEGGSGTATRKPAAPRKPRAKSPAAPAVEPASPPAPRIFQIYFEAWQRDLLDPAFVPLDNSGPSTELLEFDLFERLWRSEHVRGVPLWGALSWRFAEKTGLTGSDLLGVIAEHPGHDVYFCNPYPQHEALYHNQWLQGEASHPRFLELVRAFLAGIGAPDEALAILPSQLFSSANYFVGSPAFWAAYLPWIRGAIAKADTVLPPEIARELHSPAADDRNIHAGQSYLPFIVERLFSLFLRTDGRGLKAFKLPLPSAETEMNVHLRLLREMKDAAWSARNGWLAACWVNYRTLYLQQYYGREWMQKYLRAVTPTEIRFA